MRAPGPLLGSRQPLWSQEEFAIAPCIIPLGLCTEVSRVSLIEDEIFNVQLITAQYELLSTMNNESADLGCAKFGRISGEIWRRNGYPFKVANHFKVVYDPGELAGIDLDREPRCIGADYEACEGRNTQHWGPNHQSGPSIAVDTDV